MIKYLLLTRWGAEFHWCLENATVGCRVNSRVFDTFGPVDLVWVVCLQKEPCGSTREAWRAGVWGTQDRIKLDAVMKVHNTSRSETSLGTSLKENRGDNYYLYWVNSQFNDIAKGVWLYYRTQIQSDFFQCKEVVFATFHCIEETTSNFVHLFLVSIFWKEISDYMELGLKGG